VEILDEQTGAPEEENYNGNSQPDFDITSLFNAPDIASFIKLPTTQTSREYEQRVKSLLKAGVIGAINVENWADAATLLYHGPGFAAAAGQLANADDHAKRAIDLFTTPSSPLGMFIVTAIPLISQLMRNHEKQLKEAPSAFRTRKERRAARRAEQDAQPKVTVHLPFGKTIRMRVRAKFPIGRVFAAFRGQTRDPSQLAYEVFNNPKLQAELLKQGVILTHSRPVDET
jgi:hypothetical protein